MKVESKSPDLSTIVARIEDNFIDLQPEFQRDSVWNIKKKQGLIDTILREWKFPPVFMVVTENSETLDVLDGQQRLTAVHEFCKDGFKIDGNIEPHDTYIVGLDGLFYSQMPKSIKAKFDRYSITVHELTDYVENEPYELFFRLNQGSALTPAEKRNTFYGKTRDEVRMLVKAMHSFNIGIDKIGFNNNRLSYHDVIARVLYALERQSIEKKINDNDLVKMYRSKSGPDSELVKRIESAIQMLSISIERKVKLNKATLFTWLLFFSLEESVEHGRFISFFESNRLNSKDLYGSSDVYDFLLSLYQEKSASSVNDANPVKIRLFVIYAFYLRQYQISDSERARVVMRILDNIKRSDKLNEDALLSAFSEFSWGKL